MGCLCYLGKFGGIDFNSLIFSCTISLVILFSIIGILVRSKIIPNRVCGTLIFIIPMLELEITINICSTTNLFMRNISISGGMGRSSLSLLTAASWLCGMFLKQRSECLGNYETCYCSDDYDWNKVGLSTEKPQ
jgi:hypothetical protein